MQTIAVTITSPMLSTIPLPTKRRNFTLSFSIIPKGAKELAKRAIVGSVFRKRGSRGDQQAMVQTADERSKGSNTKIRRRRKQARYTSQNTQEREASEARKARKAR
jgi:hypothetical protein